MIAISTSAYSAFLFDLEDRQIIECENIMVKKKIKNGVLDYTLSGKDKELGHDSLSMKDSFSAKKIVQQ